MDALTGDAAALIEKLGAGPVHVVGLSMGGVVGLLIALRGRSCPAPCARRRRGNENENENENESGNESENNENENGVPSAFTAACKAPPRAT